MTMSLISSPWQTIGRSPVGSRPCRTHTRKRPDANGSHWLKRITPPAGLVDSRLRCERTTLIGGIGLDGSAGDGSTEPALGYWLGQPYWGRGYAREAVAAVIDYGFQRLGFGTIRAYTDPANTRSLNVLLHSGLAQVGEIDLLTATRNGARRAPLFRISRHGYF